MGNTVGRVRRERPQRPLKMVLSDPNTKFPLLVSVVTNEDGEGSDVMQLFIEQKTTVLQFARIKVIEPPSLGFEYKDSQYEGQRQMMIGEELLIPLSFHGRLTPMTSTYEEQLFTSIQQMPCPPPPVIYLLTDTLLRTVDNSRTMIKHKGTPLKVVCVTHKETTKLILRDAEGHLLSVNEETPLKFSALPPLKDMSLSKFVETCDLPKVVTFSQLEELDVATHDSDTFMTLAATLAGPVQIQEVCRAEVVVAWMQNLPPDTNMYRAFLIPRKVLPKITITNYVSATKKTEIYNQFRSCKFSTVVSSKLYTKNLRSRKISYIDVLIE